MSFTLYLIPAPVSEENRPTYLDSETSMILRNLRHFIVEEEKTARRFLKTVDPDFPVRECLLLVCNEHSSHEDIERCVAMLKNHDVGLLSEAGCPCVADPGAEIVRLAHQHHVEVKPLIGPSSILLALMASGLNGQNFAFNGYLPQEKTKRLQKIRDLERRSQVEHQTQLFMDTPYRNQALLEDVLTACHPSTLLSIASDLTGPQQTITTRTVAEWKKSAAVIPKIPAIFSILRI